MQGMFQQEFGDSQLVVSSLSEEDQLVGKKECQQPCGREKKERDSRETLWCGEGKPTHTGLPGRVK